MRGASVVFSVTDFLQAIFSPSVGEKAAAAGKSIGFYCRDYEAQQNKNIIDAVAKIDTLERFIFSSLPNMDKLSGGKYSNVYHCDGKAIAEEYGKATYPQLWEKTTVFYAGFYLENLLDPEVGVHFLPKIVGNSSHCVLTHIATEFVTDVLLEQSYGHRRRTGRRASHHIRLPLVLRQGRHGPNCGIFDS